MNEITDTKSFRNAEELQKSDLAKRAGIKDHDMVVRFLNIDQQKAQGGTVNVTKLNISDEELLRQMNGED